MTPGAMVATALLLGAFVAMAGAYGLLYCAARLSDKGVLRTATHFSGVALCIVAAATIIFTPLHPWWKVLVAASCGIYLAIPPVTWRYLNGLHRGNRRHGPQSAKRADRDLFGLFRRA